MKKDLIELLESFSQELNEIIQKVKGLPDDASEEQLEWYLEKAHELGFHMEDAEVGD